MRVLRKPKWLRDRLGDLSNQKHVNRLIDSYSLNTVCKEANCPNKSECFRNKTATFMILGNICTRNCSFCNVSNGIPEGLDSREPAKVAEAVIELGLRHVVITSVTRDDLADGGASQFAKVIEEIRKREENIVVEVLIPDFNGDLAALKTVIDKKPDILNHNIETVQRLYAEVRPQAIYERSLELLKRVKDLNPNIMTKSGIMLGLGETKKEVIEVLKDLRKNDVDFLTIGQYLQPSKQHYHLKEYIHPSVFDEYREKAIALGFKFVASSPLVRSSYNAAEFYNMIRNNKNT
jgi:lipoic acid synthetase